MNEDLDKSIDKMLDQTGLFGDSENTINMKDRDNRPTEKEAQFDASSHTSGEDPQIDSSWLDPIEDEAEKISSNREKEERLESLRQKEEGLRRNFSNQEEIDTDSDVYKEWEDTFNQIQRLEHNDIQVDEPDWLSSQQEEEQERLTERMRNLVDRRDREVKDERRDYVESKLDQINEGSLSESLRPKYERELRDLGGHVEEKSSTTVGNADKDTSSIDRLMKEIEETPAEDEFAATTQTHTTIESETQDSVYEAKANAQSMVDAALKEPDEDSLGTLLTDFYDRRDRALEDGDEKSAQVYSDYASKLVYLYQLDTNPDESEKIAVDIKEIEERGNASSIDYKTYIGLTYDEDENVQAVATRMANNDERITQEGLTSSQAKEKWDEYVDPFKRERESTQSPSEETQPNRRVEGSDADNPLFSNAINSGFISREELDNVNPLIRDVARRAGSPRFNNPREYWGTANDRISDRIFELESKGDLSEAEQSELRDLNEYLGRIWGIMENMPVEAQPQQVVGGGFSAQAEGNLDQMARLQSQGLEDEKKQARKEAEIAYQNFLRSERHPNSPLKLIDPDSTADLPVFFSGNEKLGIEGLSVQEQKEHRARRELVNIVYAKRGAVTLEDFSNIAEYAGLRNNELDALEEVPGMVLARREYIRIVQASTDVRNNDAQITYFGDDGNEHQIRWDEVQTTEQLELFRNEIKNRIRNEMVGLPRIQQKLRGIDDPIQQAQLVDRYAQEAEQVAFNMLYATNFFEAYQTHWDGDTDTRDFVSGNKSYAVSSMIYGSMFPLDRLVKESLTTRFKRNSEQVTNLAHANFVREAERKGYDLDEVSKNIGTITILPNKGTGIRGRGEPNFWSISEHDGKYDITVYSPFFDTRVMKDFWDDSRALKINQKPLAIASRGERINWTRDAEEGAFNSITITARNLNAYETIMRSNEMIKGVSIKGGPDVPEWVNKAMDAATKAGKSGDEDTLRGLLYSSAILDTNRRAPVITKARKMETQWEFKRTGFILGNDPGYDWDIDGWSGKFRWI